MNFSWPSTVACGLCVLALSHCAGHRPSPVRDQPLTATQALTFGLLDASPVLSSSLLEQCREAFPAVQYFPQPVVQRLLFQQGISLSDVARWGNDFSPYKQIQGFTLLLSTFEAEGHTYLRIANYLFHNVKEIRVDQAMLSCKEILQAARVVVIESHPPIADVWLDERQVGEAPVWVALADGTHTVTCTLPGEVFRPERVLVPDQVRVLCERENRESQTDIRDKPTIEEGASSVFLFVIGSAFSLAGVAVPLYFLLR